VKKLFIVTFIILLASVGIYFFLQYKLTQKIIAIHSFEQCSKVFPVLTTYPAQCKTPDGRVFTQEISSQDRYRDEIIIDFPRPQTLVESPLTITGKAKGSWFFEGSFPIELVDENGKTLGQAAAKAQGDWMTSDFVSFKGEITFVKPLVAKGKLIIKNDNPSGNSENQKEIKIPVNF